MREPASGSLLNRILTSLVAFPRRRNEHPTNWIDRWLHGSEVGQQWRSYLVDESELVGMAANRLNISGDDELREIGLELARVSHRLRALAGV